MVLLIMMWAARWALFFFFVPAGFYKFITPKEKLLPRFGWVESFTPPQIKLVALADLAGGLGILLPVLANIVPWLSTVAAAGIVVLMLAAIRVHLKRKENCLLQVLIALVALALLCSQFV